MFQPDGEYLFTICKTNIFVYIIKQNKQQPNKNKKVGDKSTITFGGSNFAVVVIWKQFMEAIGVRCRILCLSEYKQEQDHCGLNMHGFYNRVFPHISILQITRISKTLALF